MPLDQEALAANLLTFTGAFGIGEGHLFHRGSTVLFVGSAFSSNPQALFRVFLDTQPSVSAHTTNYSSYRMTDISQPVFTCKILKIMYGDQEEKNVGRFLNIFRSI